MEKSANFSRCRTYRYALWRSWDEHKPYAMMIGLNPSTADEVEDDPTLIRCINFAKSWGYGGVCMTNLFAYRATDPNDMKAAADPVGASNNRWLTRLAKEAGIVVAAWGNDGDYLNRASQIKNKIPNLYCLKMNKSGEPAHPLYLRAELKPVLMS